MGSGKSSIWEAVAAELWIPFVDLDDEMIASPRFEWLSIPELIKKYDWETPPFPTFRARETLVLEDVVTTNMDVSHVLSVGWWTYESPQVLNNHQYQQIWRYLPFFIDTPIDDILRRKREWAEWAEHRMDLDEDMLRQLHADRYQNYKKSVWGHWLIIKNTSTISSAVEQILDFTKKHQENMATSRFTKWNS